jgi:tetratricopeptide (TPR) repeat protein
MSSLSTTQSTISNAAPRLRRLGFAFLLLMMTLAVYCNVWRFGFVDYDDDSYVTNNPQVTSGLTLHNIAWAFTTGHAANYHPLTWISLQMDASLSKLNAGFFHLENTVLHAANVVLLFIFLCRATNHLWASAFVAAVFAVHPTHVESVAWITERKDVLSTFFLLLAMLAYLRYCDGSRWHYFLMLIWFALSLLAKQMGVTLWIVLLLLDFWPLRRSSVGWTNRLIEKIPLLLLAIAASVATFIAQRNGGAVVSAQDLSLAIRAQAAIVGYARYLLAMVWPVNLSVFYPYQRDWPWETVSACGVLLLLISGACVLLRHRQPWLIVGWLWFVIMLMPVSGMIQVGSAAIADRYLYMPSVGLCIMVAWSVRQWVIVRDSIFRRTLVGMLAIVAITFLGVMAFIQTGYWQNSHALRAHAISIINDPEDAHIQLAKLYQKEGNLSAASGEYELAIQVAPRDFTPEFEFANILQDAPAEAIPHYQRAMQLSPHNAKVANNLGVAYLRLRQTDLAEKWFRTAILDDQAYLDPHLNLASLLQSNGNTGGAAAEFKEALKIDPANSRALSGLRAHAPSH